MATEGNEKTPFEMQAPAYPGQTAPAYPEYGGPEGQPAPAYPGYGAPQGQPGNPGYGAPQGQPGNPGYGAPQGQPASANPMYGQLGETSTRTFCNNCHNEVYLLNMYAKVNIFLWIG